MGKSGFISIDYSGYEDLTNAMDQVGPDSEKAIDEILHGEGGKVIEDQIRMLLPRSGRKWRKKKRAAASVLASTKIRANEMLSVTVASSGHYHYLYFPDDGSNTRRHAGQQHFFEKGAERSKDKVIEMCIGAIAEKIGG